MNNNIWIKKALSTCLTVAIIATYSMVALAGSKKMAGEILVNGNAVNGQELLVKVDGEDAQSGRSIFSGSTVATPEDASAIVNLGKAGKIELAPNTVLHLSFDEKSIAGNLSAGRVTVLNSSKSIAVNTTDGKTVSLNAGDSAGTTEAEAQTSDNGNRGVSAAVLVAVMAGAVAAIVFAATRGRKISLGNGTTVVSTTR